MPYSGDTYSLPAGTVAVSNATANSTHVNSRFSDLESAQNAVRPVVAGGTGAASLADLIAALQALGWTFTDDVDLTGATVSGIYGRSSTATATGSAVDFTGIPSWANEIVVGFRAVTLSASSGMVVQVGDGSVVTTGYESIYSRHQTSGAWAGPSSSTTGFGIGNIQASHACFGALTMTRFDGVRWHAQGIFQSRDSGSSDELITTSGYIALSGDLDRVRVQPNTGTFTAGGLVVSWRR